MRGGQGVYVFRRSGNVFTPTQKISPQPGETLASLPWIFGEPNEKFGAAVALEDGILAVGKPVVTTTTNVTTPGSVYLFRPFGRFWSEAAKLTDPANWVGFGANLAINRDFLAVSSLGAFPYSESVTVIYRRQGPTYIPQALTSSDLSTSVLALGREFLYASLQDSRNFPSTVRTYNLRKLAP